MVRDKRTDKFKRFFKEVGKELIKKRPKKSLSELKSELREIEEIRRLERAKSDIKRKTFQTRVALAKARNPGLVRAGRDVAQTLGKASRGAVRTVVRIKRQQELDDDDFVRPRRVARRRVSRARIKKKRGRTATIRRTRKRKRVSNGGGDLFSGGFTNF